MATPPRLLFRTLSIAAPLLLDAAECSAGSFGGDVVARRPRTLDWREYPLLISMGADSRCGRVVARALRLRLGRDSLLLLLGDSYPTIPTELGRGRDPRPTLRTVRRRGFGKDILDIDPARAAKLAPLGHGSPAGAGGDRMLSPSGGPGRGRL